LFCADRFITYDPNLCFQSDTIFFQDDFLNVLDQFNIICCSCTVDIDDKSGMFCRDLRASPFQPLETRFLYALTDLVRLVVFGVPTAAVSLSLLLT